jgi:lipopolysaccharide/colanic/teichoic acid biosynthesis glycosyltransferase
VVAEQKERLVVMLVTITTVLAERNGDVFFLQIRVVLIVEARREGAFVKAVRDKVKRSMDVVFNSQCFQVVGKK